MAGGAYIRIKGGNIEIHAPGKIEQKGAAHPFMGPTSIGKEMPNFKTLDSMAYSDKLDLKNFLIDNDHLSAGKAVIFIDKTENIVEEFMVGGNTTKRFYRETPEEKYKIAVRFTENFQIIDNYIEPEEEKSDLSERIQGENNHGEY